MTNELYHFGVKGMHWGVRRYQNPDGTLTDKGKAKQAKHEKQVYKKAIKEANRNAYLDSKRMSDDELRNAVNRMNNERLYRQAVKNDYLDSLNTGERMVQNTKDRMANTTVQNLSDPLVRETIGKGSRAIGKSIAKKAAVAAI